MSSSCPYPLTVVYDRYSGVYSGGEFVAWNLEVGCVPQEPSHDDCTCSLFWDLNKIPAGIGKTPDQAIKDLQRRMQIIKEAGEEYDDNGLETLVGSREKFIELRLTEQMEKTDE